MRTAPTIRTAAAAIVVAAVGLTASTVAAAEPAAGAPARPATAATGASWLQTQLVGGNHFNTSSGTPDVGLTIDGLFAFKAAGSGYATQVSNIAAWLSTSANVSAYIGGSTANYPGGLAKLALAAQATGANPTSYAGTNLITRLQATQTTSGSTAGRFVDPRDTPTYYGYGNSTVQALGVITLKKAGVTTASFTNAVAALRGSACTATSTPNKYAYPAVYDTSTSCAGDPDTTGVAVQALAYAAGTTNVAAAQNANTWLDATKTAPSTSTSAWRNYCLPPNYTLAISVNSTSLAVQGLLADPRGRTQWSTDISKGTSWLTSTQNTNGGMPACTATGTSDVRATTQGVQGLAAKTYVDLIG